MILNRKEAILNDFKKAKAKCEQLCIELGE